MKRRNSSSVLVGIVLIIIAGASAGSSLQQRQSESVLKCAADNDSAVRFFYNPPGDHFHFPLIFRSVEETDLRLDTAPMMSEGRTAYISRVEMRRLIEGLARMDLSWQELKGIESFGSYKQIPALDTMRIDIMCAKARLKTKLDPSRICQTLKPLDAALSGPRAIWEFQAFRLDYGCKVSGFKPEAYPDH